MKKSQSGFTLIELIVVIVLLGILGVTALGKFQNLSGDAERATVNAVATELTGASSINYSKSLISSSFLFNIGDAATLTGGGATDIQTASEAGACAAALSGFLSNNAFPTVSGKAITLDVSGNTTNLCSSGAGSTYTCPVLLDGNALTPAVTATFYCTE